MALLPELTDFVEHQLFRWTIGLLPEIVLSAILVGWLPKLVGWMIRILVSYGNYEMLVLVGRLLRFVIDSVALPAMRVFGIYRVRLTPDEMDASISKFHARVEKKMKRLKVKLGNHTESVSREIGKAICSL